MSVPRRRRRRRWLGVVVAAVLGTGAAGAALVGSAHAGAHFVRAAQTSHDKPGGDEHRRGVSNLWQLYPIDPATNGTPLPTPTAFVGDAAAKKTPAPPRTQTGGDDGNPEAATGGTGAGWLVAGAAAALVVAGGGVVFATRRRPQPVQTHTRHVRVHLHDGRRIEGWRKEGYPSSDDRVIVLDVCGVYDSAGQELASTPLDSFVLPPQVDHIEQLD